MAFYEIPLSGLPENFTISLGGIPYQMQVRYADAEQGGWFLNILDQNAVPLLSGIPMVTGADLLAQFAYVGIAGSLYLYSASPAEPAPSFTDLGNPVKLYYEEASA